MGATGLRNLRVVVSALLFLGVAAVVWPAALGGRSGVVMVSGVSMQPTMHTGDLALVRQHDRYEVGEIVAFRVPKGEQGAGAIVIHRIIGGSGDQGYVLQGDNKPRPDPWRPTNADVVGARWGLVPKAGSLLSFLLAPINVAALASAVVVFKILARAPQSNKKNEERQLVELTGDCR